MLLAVWSQSNVFSFILCHRRFTVWRQPFWFPGYTTGNTATRKRSRVRKFGIVWHAILLSILVGGLGLAIPASFYALSQRRVSPTILLLFSTLCLENWKVIVNFHIILRILRWKMMTKKEKRRKKKNHVTSAGGMWRYHTWSWQLNRLLLISPLLIYTFTKHLNKNHLTSCQKTRSSL